MPSTRLLLYASANGDEWWLCRAQGSEHVFVCHEPNGPSGGNVSNIDVGRFLAEVPPGPQHQELLRLIGSLIDREHGMIAAGGVTPDPSAAAAEPTPGEETSEI